MTLSPEDNLIAMEKHITEPCIVVGHSMGGLYAWHLAKRNPELVTHGISIGTPWGGSKYVSFWSSFNRIPHWLIMLSRTGMWTSRPRHMPPACPWTNIVTTHGFDVLWFGKNDGVITIESQRELYKQSNEIILNYGHTEVLQSPELVDIINIIRLSHGNHTN